MSHALLSSGDRDPVYNVERFASGAYNRRYSEEGYPPRGDRGDEGYPPRPAYPYRGYQN